MCFYKNNDFENYTSLNLNPYYRLENDDWKIRLGAQVDMAFGFGKKFRAAPDVSVEYNFSDSYILYAQAKGENCKMTSAVWKHSVRTGR